MSARQEKITFADMRAAGVRGIFVFCADYRCSHSIRLMADRWPDDARLSDIEPQFVCKACGKRGPTCGRTSGGTSENPSAVWVTAE